MCTKLGPLVCFESLLNSYGDENSMINDMIVVIEDLRNVEFNLILVDKKSKFKLKRNNSQKSSPVVPMLEYHSFPLPRITGSRNCIKVCTYLSKIVLPFLSCCHYKTSLWKIASITGYVITKHLQTVNRKRQCRPMNNLAINC